MMGFPVRSLSCEVIPHMQVVFYQVLLKLLINEFIN